MSGVNARREPQGRKPKPKPKPGRGSRPEMEGLEPRLLLFATSGGLWSNPNLITFSIVPDGTNIGGLPSTLFQTLNAVAPTSAWASAFVQAAAIWESVANINLVPVLDHGTYLGGGPDQQGDPSQGDIRISGISNAFGGGTLAMTFLPPPNNGDSSAGDTVFNDSQPWGVNTGSNGSVDLLTIALHEMGHALGMAHTSTQWASMYPYYQGTTQTLLSDDVAGIQSIYGPRAADILMAKFNNTIMGNAPDISSLTNGPNILTVPTLDIQPGDPTGGGSFAYYFKVTVPATTTGTMAVSMQSSGLSELSPFVRILNSAGRVLSYSEAPGSYGANVTTTIGGVSPGQVYYIRTSGVGGGADAVGNYGLVVNFGSGPSPTIPSPSVTIASQASRGGGGQQIQVGNGGIGASVGGGSAVGVGSVPSGYAGNPYGGLAGLGLGDGGAAGGIYGEAGEAPDDPNGVGNVSGAVDALTFAPAKVATPGGPLAYPRPTAPPIGLITLVAPSATPAPSVATASDTLHPAAKRGPATPAGLDDWRP